jgi:hypothetical protein
VVVKKIWEIFIGKYADELSFQLSWARHITERTESCSSSLINMERV